MLAFARRLNYQNRMMVIPYHPFLPYDGHSVLHSVYSIRDFPEVVFA